jgi:hypothetical protein
VSLSAQRTHVPLSIALAEQNIEPTVITYNTLIKGYLGSPSATSSESPVEERLAKARSLMHEMRSRGT